MTLDAVRVKTKAGWPEALEYVTYRATEDALAAIGGLADDASPARILAATEIAAGELAAQRLREPGARDTVAIGPLKVSPPDVDPLDPSGLIRQGWTRLARLRGGSRG